MVSAGYNPYGAVEMMRMLENQQQVRPIEFLSTHPSPGNRVGYLTQTIETKHYDSAGLKVGKEDYRSNILEHLSN